jgi:hypothetical protein
VACFLVYWTQYCFNFLAYSLRNEQFRKENQFNKKIPAEFRIKNLMIGSL